MNVCCNLIFMIFDQGLISIAIVKRHIQAIHTRVYLSPDILQELLVCLVRCEVIIEEYCHKILVSWEVIFPQHFLFKILGYPYKMKIKLAESVSWLRPIQLNVKGLDPQITNLMFKVIYITVREISQNVHILLKMDKVT